MGLLLLCVGVAAVTSGCTPAVHVKLPVSQIVETAETGKATTADTEVMVRWEKPVHCEAELSNVVEDLKAIGVEVRDAQCARLNSGPYFSFTMDAALVPVEGERPAGEGLVFEVSPRSGKDGSIEVMMVGMNTAGKLKELTGYEEPDFVIPKIGFGVFNDTNKDYSVQFDQVFIDHEPFLADRSLDLQRYARAEVQLSDVASAVVAKGNGSRFMALYPAP